jgi:endonuclease/exonuclease/phosphatase family metal-dependent hydrolase
MAETLRVIGESTATNGFKPLHSLDLRTSSGRNRDVVKQPADEFNMRLLTYNIHKGIGGRDRRYRLERIKQAIERENPDVICLQEVDRNVRRSRSDNQPLMLGKYFRAAGRCFQLNHKLKTGGYGNLILSRWPVLARHNVSLRHGKKKERGALLAVLDTPEGALHVANCHLGLAEQERLWQVERLLAHRLFAESAHLPTLVAGDLNDWRNNLHAGPFKDHGFTHVTTPISRFRSFPASMPIASLDKAFARGEIEIVSARVVKTKLSRVASDHLPLVVDFHLKKNK